MSNCINSGINKIFVLTQFNSASLNRHIYRTYTGNGVSFGDGCVEVIKTCINMSVFRRRTTFKKGFFKKGASIKIGDMPLGFYLFRSALWSRNPKDTKSGFKVSATASLWKVT